MTDETEHARAASTGTGEHADDRTSRPDAAPLPSIIVDPLLSAAAADDPAPTARSEPTAAAEPANGAHVETNSVSEAKPDHPVMNGSSQRQQAARETELSAEAADRYAASIRASWEPPASSAASVAPAATTADAQAVVRAEQEIRGVPGTQRKLGLLITSAAVLGFGGLLALGIAHNQSSIRSAASAVATARPSASKENEPGASAPQATASREVGAAQPPSSPPEEQAVAPSALATAPSGFATPEPEAVEAETETASTGSEPQAAAEISEAPELPAAAPAQAAAPPSSATASATTAAPSAVPTTPPPAPQPAPAQLSPLKSAAATAPAQTKPATVRVRIAALPRSARLTLDGAPIPNPFDADMVKGGKHRVVARADGYREGDVTIELNRDRDVLLRLTPISAKPESAAATSSAAKSRASSAKQERMPAARPRSSASRPSSTARVNAAPVAPRTGQPAPAPNPRGAGFVSESPY